MLDPAQEWWDENDETMPAKGAVTGNLNFLRIISLGHFANARADRSQRQRMNQLHIRAFSKEYLKPE